MKLIIEDKTIEGRGLSCTIRCPREADAIELSELRVKIDGETENLDREAGEAFLTPEDFGTLIRGDSIADNVLFLVGEVDGKIVGFTRCVGSKLSRFRHKAEFGICVLKEYWGNGIGKMLLENVLTWADNMGIVRISLSVVQTNGKAIELYKRYGFVEEGVMVKDRIHKDGNYYNTVIMGRIDGGNKLK